ncbi:glycosyltransferase family 4 protein [Candidatus Uhrbacteria bacterium]|jgi:glycosyltransferase involved in cell wall biosynthesis|nr:glycosyltransferase family 4 protein [Candidatus Uhrbacteria bacterium]
MIIGIDANALTRTNHTGTERYLKALLLHMGREPLASGEQVILYTSAPVKSIEPLPEGWSWKVVKWPLKKGWTHGGLSLELLRRPPDIFFTPVHEVPLFHRRAQIVNTIHDVAFAIEPKTYSALSRLRQQWAVKRAVKHSKHLITVSETTKQDLHRLYKVPFAKMSVTHLAINVADYADVGADRMKTTLDTFRLYPNKFFITIGRVEEKKNIGLLLEAFFAYKKRRGIGDPTELVLAGSHGDGIERFKKQVTKSSFSSDVHFIGFISDEQKAALLQGAMAYVFPSRYEGFGIPALEAFASDCPLLASDIPALREVAGDAALYAPVDIIDNWARQMERVALNDDVRDRLTVAGRGRLKDFSWDSTARKTWDVLRSIG